MFVVREKPHVHDFTKLGYLREAGTTADGKFIDRIILIRTCECGRSQAFECGDKDLMRKLYKELEG